MWGNFSLFRQCGTQLMGISYIIHGGEMLELLYHLEDFMNQFNIP
jgi:hypothetical protein